MSIYKKPPSPLENWTDVDFGIGCSLLIKRDDLIPFPLAGNKVRKLAFELADVDLTKNTVLTVGAITSNHCRTAAMFAARGGGRAHLILHGDSSAVSAKLTLEMLGRLGATWDLVPPAEIPHSIELAKKDLPGCVHFVAGGCHTPSGVEAYAQAVKELATQLDAPPDCIYLASGTGATQAGIIAGCHDLGWTSTRVRGISVARDRLRGARAVREALTWRNLSHLQIDFSDEYRAGGYGKTDPRTENARDIGWRAGLPLDGTYTAKAFAALLEESRARGSQESVLFWHTGGLNTQLSMDVDAQLTTN